jgi:hypothetical protein
MIESMNQTLADKRGRNLYGDAIFKWVRTRDLFVYVDGVREPQFPELSGDEWIVAKWDFEPPDVWRAKYGPGVPWPERGEYYGTDYILPPGIEPSDRYTQDFLRALQHVEGMTAGDHAYDQQWKRQRRERRASALVGDYVDDKFTAFFNAPGKRGGHVSFGGL